VHERERDGQTRPPRGRTATAPEGLAHYEVGQRVKIKGRRQGECLFRAATIKSNPDGREWDELEGIVEWFRAEERTLGVLGVEVRIGEPADEDCASRMASAIPRLGPGVMAKVSGRRDEGRLIAQRIVVKDVKGVLVEEIQGRVQAVDVREGTMQVAGFLVTADRKTECVY
jgi:hypothetical protein